MNDSIDPTAIRFRRVQFDDIDTIAHYRMVFLKEFYSLTQPVTSKAATKKIRTPASLKKSLRSYLRRGIADGTFVGYIAEAEKNPVGFSAMVIQTIPGNFKNPSGMQGYILNMYTVPAFRSRGICAHLLDLLVGHAKKTGIGKLYLHASPLGQPVYARAGFSIPTVPEMELFLRH